MILSREPFTTCHNCGVRERQDFMVMKDVGHNNIQWVHPVAEGRCKPIIVDYIQTNYLAQAMAEVTAMEGK